MQSFVIHESVGEKMEKKKNHRRKGVFVYPGGTHCVVLSVYPPTPQSDLAPTFLILLEPGRGNKEGLPFLYIALA